MDDEIDDQAAFLAPLMGDLNRAFPNPPPQPQPKKYCAGCGKELPMIMSIMGVPAPTGFIILDAKNIHLKKDENGVEMWSDPPQAPGMYCVECVNKRHMP